MGCKGKYFNLRESNSFCRKLDNKDLYDLYSSKNVATMVMKKDKIVAPCDKHERRETCTRFWWENVQKRECLKREVTARDRSKCSIFVSF
jgi:hypothetical protein